MEQQGLGNKVKCLYLATYVDAYGCLRVVGGCGNTSTQACDRQRERRSPPEGS